MRADSPSFHKWGKKPPADVLDLGCGEGFWVLHAAKLWKPFGTKVTGLDLIDLHNNGGGFVCLGLFLHQFFAGNNFGYAGFQTVQRGNPLAVKIVDANVKMAIDDTFYSPINCESIFLKD